MQRIWPGLLIRATCWDIVYSVKECWQTETKTKSSRVSTLPLHILSHLLFIFSVSILTHFCSFIKPAFAAVTLLLFLKKEDMKEMLQSNDPCALRMREQNNWNRFEARRSKKKKSQSVMQHIWCICKNSKGSEETLMRARFWVRFRRNKICPLSNFTPTSLSFLKQKHFLYIKKQPKVS